MTQPIVSYFSTPASSLRMYALLIFIHIYRRAVSNRFALCLMLWLANPWWACAAAEPHLPFPPERKWIAILFCFWAMLYVTICVFCGASVRVCKLIWFLQKARIQIWLFEQKDLRIEGRIIVSFLALFYLSQRQNLAPVTLC